MLVAKIVLVFNNIFETSRPLSICEIRGRLRRAFTIQKFIDNLSLKNNGPPLSPVQEPAPIWKVRSENPLLIY